MNETEEKVEKVLVVCANCDRKDNFTETVRLVVKLLYQKMIEDNVYKYVSVNPDKPVDKLQYNEHIAGYFGSKELVLRDLYRVIIFKTV